jgi:hypothetical protein
MNVEAIRSEMLEQAHTVAMDHLNTRYGGKDMYACGFAWVTVYPEHKGNTRAGKAEVLRKYGFTASAGSRLD